MSGKRNTELNAPDSEGHPLEHASSYHAPVLCNAVVEGIISDPGGTYIDATLGGGGHTEAILSTLSRSGKVIGLDRDQEAIAASSERLKSFMESGQLTLVHGNFLDVGSLVESREIDGVLMDLGVSSHQLDVSDRGFSFRVDGPLDMRMNQTSGRQAADFLNESSVGEIVRVLRQYGEEPRARAIATAIVDVRPLTSTSDLTRIIEQLVAPPKRSKTLARVFQAIRIQVNGEIEALEEALMTFTRLIRPGGRMAVISYHSLEDRRAKRLFRTGNFEGNLRRDLYGNRLVPWTEVTKKPVMASEEELKINPRSRSARLRIAERTRYSGITDTDE